jgi:hypothetical protein
MLLVSRIVCSVDRTLDSKGPVALILEIGFVRFEVSRQGVVECTFSHTELGVTVFPLLASIMRFQESAHKAEKPEGDHLRAQWLAWQMLGNVFFSISFSWRFQHLLSFSPVALMPIRAPASVGLVIVYQARLHVHPPRSTTRKSFPSARARWETIGFFWLYL